MGVAWMALGVSMAVAQVAPEGADPHVDLALQARTAEKDGEYARAIELCQGAIDALPTGHRTPHCRERIAFLEARRDTDGDFGGWGELEAVRTEYRTLGPQAAADRVGDLLDRDDLSEITRVEGTLWLARDALDRLDDPERAMQLTEPLLESHQGELRKKVVGLHAIALARTGELEQAAAVEREIRVQDPESAVRATPVEEVARARLEAVLQVGALGGMGVFGAVVLPLAARAREAPFSPWGLVPIGVACGGAWGIAELWARGAGQAVPWMFAGFAAVYLLVSRALYGRDDWTGLAVRVLAVVAVGSVALLALIRTNTLRWVW